MCEFNHVQPPRFQRVAQGKIDGENDVRCCKRRKRSVGQTQPHEIACSNRCRSSPFLRYDLDLPGKMAATRFCRQRPPAYSCALLRACRAATQPSRFTWRARPTASAPAGTRILVMTHDHALDYALCKAALLRADMAWIGLIGSRSKAARFRSRLRHDGIAEDAIARLTCPVGITGIGSKWPAAIAVSVAAQILQTLPQGSHVHEPLTEPGCTPEACASCHQMHGVRP